MIIANEEMMITQVRIRTAWNIHRIHRIGNLIVPVPSGYLT